MFHEVEYPSLTTRYVYLVSIGQSQTANQVQQVQTTVKCVKDCSVDILEISPIPSEVVVGVSERVHYELNCDTHDHHDAQDWRSLLHGVVVFEDEPLRSYPDTYGKNEQHPSNGEVDFGVDASVDSIIIGQSSKVVLAAAKELGTGLTHYSIYY